MLRLNQLIAVRVVSDIVHFNNQFKDRDDFKKQDINDVVLGKSEILPYYPDHGRFLNKTKFSGT